jgi:hypothetical protein
MGDIWEDEDDVKEASALHSELAKPVSACPE